MRRDDRYGRFVRELLQQPGVSGRPVEVVAPGGERCLDREVDGLTVLPASGPYDYIGLLEAGQISRGDARGVAMVHQEFEPVPVHESCLAAVRGPGDVPALPGGCVLGVEALDGGEVPSDGLLPVLKHLLSILKRLLPVLEHPLPVLERLLPVLKHLLPVLERFLPVLERLLPVFQKSESSVRALHESGHVLAEGIELAGQFEQVFTQDLGAHCFPPLGVVPESPEKVFLVVDAGHLSSTVRILPLVPPFVLPLVLPLVPSHDVEPVAVPREPGYIVLVGGQVGFLNLPEHAGGAGAASLGFPGVERAVSGELPEGLLRPAPRPVRPADEHVPLRVLGEGLRRGEPFDLRPGLPAGPAFLRGRAGGRDVYPGVLEFPGPVPGAGSRLGHGRVVPEELDGGPVQDGEAEDVPAPRDDCKIQLPFFARPVHPGLTMVLVYPGFLRTSSAVAVGPDRSPCSPWIFTLFPWLAMMPRPVISPSFLFWMVTMSPVEISWGPKWVLFPACPGVGVRERSLGLSRQYFRKGFPVGVPFPSTFAFCLLLPFLGLTWATSPGIPDRDLQFPNMAASW